jgi:transposase
MRGKENHQSQMFHTFSIEDLIPLDHPLRKIREVCDAALQRLNTAFEAMYSDTGRPSIAPEVVLKSLILQALYSIRSERQLSEQIGYNVLYRWFLGMSMSTPVFDPTVFGKNRERLIEHEIGREFLVSTVEEARRLNLISEEHFSVDGTLLEAWASMKSFVRKGGGDSGGGQGGSNRWVDFHGEKRSNETHGSVTDPDARLMKKGKGKEAKLSYCSNVLMENRNGLIVGTAVKSATGTAEVEAAMELLDRAVEEGLEPASVGADKGYHCQAFVQGCREREVKPHVSQQSGRKVAGLDGRTAASPAYRVSQIVRKRIEEQFGWGKTIAGLRKLKVRGVAKVGMLVDIVSSAFNVLRIARLSTA